MPYICGSRWLSLGPVAAKLSLRMSRAVCDTSSTFRASLPSLNWSRRAARPWLAPASRFFSRSPCCHWSNTCKCRNKGRLSDILEVLHLRNSNRPFQGQVFLVSNQLKYLLQLHFMSTQRLKSINVNKGHTAYLLLPYSFSHSTKRNKPRKEGETTHFI